MPTDCVGDRLKPRASCWLMWRVAHSSAWPHGRILRKSMNITWLMAPRLRPVRSFHLSLCDTWVSLVFFRSSPRQDDSFRGHLYWRGLLSSQPCGIVIMSSFLFSLSLVIRHSLTWATATEGRGGCSSEMHEFRVKLVNKNWNSRVLSLSVLVVSLPFCLPPSRFDDHDPESLSLSWRGDLNNAWWAADPAPFRIEGSKRAVTYSNNAPIVVPLSP